LPACGLAPRGAAPLAPSPQTNKQPTFAQQVFHNASIVAIIENARDSTNIPGKANIPARIMTTTTGFIYLSN
jgi:hypothetical protein